MFQPIIKWSGSKCSQSTEILKYFPRQIKTYYEPFCGGASMLRALLDSNIKCERFVASDINNDLISLWNLIKSNPDMIAYKYDIYWRYLNKDNDVDRKRRYFEIIRERFNKLREPEDFFFIMRTTTNGMPRYNKNGDFNNSFHLTRNGIEPGRMESILYEWSNLLREKNVEFIHQSYDAIKPEEGDFVYLDPPYANTKGMYYGSIDNDHLFDFLRGLPCSWAMSYNGISGDTDNTFDVPSDVFDSHEYIKSGNSSFKRIKESDKDAMVYESLYLKGCKKQE